jgi:hypothetical protein
MLQRDDDAMIDDRYSRASYGKLMTSEGGKNSASAGNFRNWSFGSQRDDSQAGPTTTYVSKSKSKRFGHY